MTIANQQKIRGYLFGARGKSILANAYRMAAKRGITDYDKLVVTIQEQIKDNPVIVDRIIGKKGFEFFKEYQLSTSFAPTEDEGTE